MALNLQPDRVRPWLALAREVSRTVRHIAITVGVVLVVVGEPPPLVVTLLRALA